MYIVPWRMLTFYERVWDTTCFFVCSSQMLAWIIRIIHFFVLAFVALTPFFGDEYFLTLHLLIIPFIMLHWLTNQTVCALTELEKIVRGGCDAEDTIFGQIVNPIYKDESFIGQLLGPVYTFKDADEEKRAVWIGLITLWCITLARLWPTGFRQLRGDLERLLSLLRTPPR